MSGRLQKLSTNGQSIWCDNISRPMLNDGELSRLIGTGVVGVTSNPTIFMKAITGSKAYDVRLAELSSEGRDTLGIYEGLVVPDIIDAADALHPVFEASNGADGFVSLEVSPRLAHDTHATVAEARRLQALVNRPNLMIKVPATDEGIPAIESLIGEGINVNVTLIFSRAMYEKVMRAYLEGLRQFADRGGDLSAVASVASFFVSRVDTLVDGMLAGRGGDSVGLQGKAAVANARLAYGRFRDVFDPNGAFAALKGQGARVQRPLWASTSTKNPEYPDTMYCDDLVAPDTVNTLPPATIEAVMDHGKTDIAIHDDLSREKDAMEQLESAGIDMTAVTDKLLADGVASFAQSFDDLIADIERKRATLSTA